MSWLTRLKSVFKLVDNLDTIPKKLNKLLKSKINIVGTELLHTKRLFISKDAYKYIMELEYIINSDIAKEAIYIKPITNDKLYEVTYLNWLSNDGYIEEDINGLLYRFISVCDKFYYIYLTGNKDTKNIVYYNNCRKLRPYITNIEEILDDILSIVHV